MMKNFKWAFLSLAALSISACDKKDDNIAEQANTDTTVSETILDDVDEVEGTISDAMINVEGLDETTDAPEEGSEGNPKDSKDSENKADTEDNSKEKKDSE